MLSFDFKDNQGEELQNLRNFCETGNRFELAECRFPFLEHPIYARGQSTDWANIFQMFIQDEFKPLEELRPSTVFDLGGYAGYAAVYIASKLKPNFILSVEPDPDNYALLLLNSRPYSSIKAINAGVWKDSGFLEIDQKIGGDWGTTVKQSTAASNQPPSAIRSYSLEDLISLYHVDFIDLLKVDIEGSEVELFHPNAKWLSQKVGIAAIETHDRFKEGCTQAVLDFFPETSFERDQSGEKLIFTRRAYEQINTKNQSQEPQSHSAQKTDSLKTAIQNKNLNRKSDRAKSKSISSQSSSAFSNTNSVRDKHFLSIIAIFKNESHILKEWISHHLFQGVDHFYLINNNSTDNYLDALRSVPGDLYTLVDDHRDHAQLEILNDHYRLFGPETKWICPIDLDEFIYIRFGGQTISEYLHRLPGRVSAVCMPWKMYGSSGHVKQPDSVRQGFTSRAIYNGNTQNPGMLNKETSIGKYIAKTSRIKTLAVHSPDLIKGCSILSNGDHIDYNNIHFPTSEKLLEASSIHLNHYAVQSWEWFRDVKMTRGDIQTKTSDNVRNRNYFESYDLNIVNDPSILRNQWACTTLASN